MRPNELKLSQYKIELILVNEKAKHEAGFNLLWIGLYSFWKIGLCFV